MRSSTFNTTLNDRPVCSENIQNLIVMTHEIEITLQQYCLGPVHFTLQIACAIDFTYSLIRGKALLGTYTPQNKMAIILEAL